MKTVLCSILTLFAFTGSAQYDHESVFSDLDGDNLRTAIIQDFKTSNVLTYSEARDTFFRNIDAVENVLECVYTGYTIDLDPNLDPTEDAFGKGINTEHTFPRSKGAFENTNAFSDMHHLFPTREKVNTDRGSLPFQDISDSQTDKWYFEENILTSVPGQNIDAYSELLTNSSFEPREQHKGDVARACFYFYTMYKSQADQADPEYFETQRETLCQWHFQDPVDEKEWVRNEKIAAYQDGKKNPFILDCKLARLYCDEIEGSCLTVSTTELATQTLSIRPNPVHEVLFLAIDDALVEKYAIYALDGSMVKSGWVDLEDDATIPTTHLNSGFYIVKLLSAQGHIRATAKFIKL